MTDTHVLLSNVSRWYLEGGARRVVLDGVNQSLARGSAVALTGPSGSGKSTLLNLLSGIDSPDSGDIQIAGRSIVSGNETQRTLYRRQYIGLVFQAFNLLPTLTLYENVALPLQLNRVDTRDVKSRVLDILSQVGLAERCEAFPHSLSGGEQQRVAIARALVHKPDLVLADEPTGNLDAANARTIMTLLLDMVRAQHGSLVVATHSREVANRTDHVWSIADRKVRTVAHNAIKNVTD